MNDMDIEVANVNGPPPQGDKSPDDSAVGNVSMDDSGEDVPPPSAAEAAASTAAQAAEQRKRDMNARHSRCKRERKRIELDFLRDECTRLSMENMHIYRNNKFLEDKMAKAKALIERYEKNPASFAFPDWHIAEWGPSTPQDVHSELDQLLFELMEIDHKISALRTELASSISPDQFTASASSPTTVADEEHPSGAIVSKAHNNVQQLLMLLGVQGMLQTECSKRYSSTATAGLADVANRSGTTSGYAAVADHGKPPDS